MNTTSLVSRIDTNALPQWGAASPGYIAMNSGGGSGAGNDAAQNRAGSQFRMVFRRYWWIAALAWAIIAIPATIIIFKIVKPEYLAVGYVNVAPVVVNPVSGSEATNPFYTEYLRTQAELMKNPFVLQRAAEDVRLRSYPWFRQLSDQVGYLADHVEVSPGGATQNISVMMTHPDAAAATAIVDSVIDAYFRTQGELDDQNMAKSLNLLKQLQATTDKSLKDAQDKLARLTSDGNMVWSEQDQKVLVDVISNAKETLGKLEGDQLNLQSQLDDLKIRKIPNQALYMAAVPTDTDPQIVQWVQEQIRTQVADNVLASKHATLEHPDRIEFRKQLKVLDGKIADRRKQIQQQAWDAYSANFSLDQAKKVNDLSADLAAVNQQIASLQKRIDSQEASAKDLGAKSQPILALKEQITDSKEALKRYNDRIEEIENLNRAPGRVTALGPTVQPKTPKVDKRKNYIATANGLGLMLGLGVLVLMMKLRDKIDNAEDLRDMYQPLIVGTVSHAGISARGMPGRIGRKILGEEMRLLHANLLPPGRGERRVMMITSPTPSNGKTSIASQLALSLAKSGLEVLLIDADLRKRDLSTMFDVGFRPGLADLLQGITPELIRPVELLPNLRLMGAGSRLERNPVELFQRQHFHESLALLHDHFDCIVVDTPPTLVVADARLIAQSCDEILCVVRAQVSSPKEVDQTIDALTRITGKSPKIIVNGVTHRQSYYKYKFAYTDGVAEEQTVTADAMGRIE
jgi:capsular exopolysaccharide synthesis family protein